MTDIGEREGYTMRYVDTAVWLSVPGGVEGWNLSALNDRIDRWNHKVYPLIGQVCSFWDWLSDEEGQTYYGFSILWRSKLFSHVHSIKGEKK